MELIGLYLIAAGLLVGAGVTKTLWPDDTARAMARLLPRRVASTPRLRGVIRLGALAEVALGLLALVAPRPATAALVALSYVVFLGVVVAARWRGGPLATCGCFGRPDTPATGLHVAVNAALAAAAGAVALHAPHAGSIVTVLTHQPWAGFPLLFVSAVGLWLTVLVLSALASLEGARRLVRRPVPPGAPA